MTGIAAYWRNYIDGAFVDGGAGRIAVHDPGSGAVLCEHALADAADVNRAVAAARACVIFTPFMLPETSSSSVTSRGMTSSLATVGGVTTAAR